MKDNKIFKKVTKMCKKASVMLAFLVITGVSFAAPTVTPAAGGTGSLDPAASINKLYTLIAGFVSSIGGIALLFGAFTFGKAWWERDEAAKMRGIEVMVGGLIMCAAPWIVIYFTTP